MIAKLAVGATMALALFSATSLAVTAASSPITRTELIRSDISGVKDKEAIIYIADVQPGAAGGMHTHFGDEFVYVLDGTLIVEPSGNPPIVLKSGEMGHLTPDIVHAARNASSTDEAKVLVILITDKGKPMAEALVRGWRP